jgi:hypothetical protein
VSLALVTAAAALVSGLVTAAVTGWLAGRAKVAEELREARLRIYPPLWKRTSTLSRWPRTDLTWAGLERLHFDLRHWYYDTGGLYLSENARARYGELQELMAAQLDSSLPQRGDELPASAYDPLMHSASSFRTALTEDLESRRQRSLWWTLSRARIHRTQQRDARRRLAATTAGATGRFVRYALTDADHVMADVAPDAPAATAARATGVGAGPTDPAPAESSDR